MVKLYDGGVFLLNGTDIVPENDSIKNAECIRKHITKYEARKGTIAYSILNGHNSSGSMDNLQLRFDAMASHDITYVGIVQTAVASGLKKFPVPYVLTNCHNSLCAVGGTINEDDHVFGLSAAKKFGGIFVPPHIAVIHQYMREMFAGCGKMILASDSHTRYGALGTLAVGEGGGELVKQLLRDTYDIAYPQVIGVYLEGKPSPATGPQDIALAIIGAVFKNGYVKNKVMEFVGPGIANLSSDFRNGVDVMTTETACWTSVWKTDSKTQHYLEKHGRGSDYRELNPAAAAYYDGMIRIDLSSIKPMIALPFHPSNTYELDEFAANAGDILRSVEKDAAERFNGVQLHLTDKLVNGKMHVQQGIIAGCAGGTYTNVMQAAHILKGRNCGSGEFSLSVYPASQPVYMELVRNGAAADLMEAGATLKTAFCGPCFGAGDTPANEGFSIRHSTRNFPNREGSKPGSGQIACVALMDARSIAATAANGGILTSAEKYAEEWEIPEYHFDSGIYEKRVYNGYGRDNTESELVYGPNIKPWPALPALKNSVVLKICSKIMDSVTTTDELIPSGETSSYRSNPLGLAEFTLSRRDPEYVGRAKAAFKENSELMDVLKKIHTIPEYKTLSEKDIETGSAIYAVKPGDGSAREQAASCQRVLGGLANFASDYATKRYRSNVINWGMLPFTMKGTPSFDTGAYIFVPDIIKALDTDASSITGYVLSGKIEKIELHIAALTPAEKATIKAGCLINYNKARIQS